MPCEGAACTVSPPRKTIDRVREPTPTPIVKRVVKRAPTPAGDVVERITVKRVPQTIVENITEQPRKPAPRVIEKTEIEAAPRPVTFHSCTFVEPTIPNPATVVEPCPRHIPPLRPCVVPPRPDGAACENPCACTGGVTVAHSHVSHGHVTHGCGPCGH